MFSRFINYEFNFINYFETLFRKLWIFFVQLQFSYPLPIIYLFYPLFFLLPPSIPFLPLLSPPLDFLKILRVFLVFYSLFSIKSIFIQTPKNHQKHQSAMTLGSGGSSVVGEPIFWKPHNPFFFFLLIFVMVFLIFHSNLVMGLLWFCSFMHVLYLMCSLAFGCLINGLLTGIILIEELTC